MNCMISSSNTALLLQPLLHLPITAESQADCFKRSFRRDTASAGMELGLPGACLTSNKAVKPPLLYMPNHLVIVASLLCNNLTKSCRLLTMPNLSQYNICRRSLPVAVVCLSSRCSNSSRLSRIVSSRGRAILIPLQDFYPCLA